jgi:putative transposase
MATPSHYKTCRRYNDPGHAHALTFSCFQRRPFLNRDRTRTWFVEAVNRARRIHDFHVWAWVIMPEHAHLLIWPTQPEYSISGIWKSIKLSVARKAIQNLQRESPAGLEQLTDRQPNGRVHYRFWQRGGGYDRNITEPKTIWAEIDYIHANPSRRGLCLRATDWVWSGAMEMETGIVGLIPLNRESLPRTIEG